LPGSATLASTVSGTVTAENAQARAFQEIPIVATPRRKSLALPGAGGSVDVRAGSSLLPLVRGLSWQHEHGRPHPHVYLRLGKQTSIRLAAGGKRVSIAQFARFLHKTPFAPLIVTWASTPKTNGQLLRTPPSAITVSPH
jgi:hypothetical protein